MKTANGWAAVVCGAVLAVAGAGAWAQTAQPSNASPTAPVAPQSAAPQPMPMTQSNVQGFPAPPLQPENPADRPDVPELFSHNPIELSVFGTAGFGTVRDSADTFTNAGGRIGWVITDAHGPGFLRGQFEYAIEVMPYWQAHIAPHYQDGIPQITGNFFGVSVVPVILKWNFVPVHHYGGSSTIVPWIQGGGGSIWTNHKFPPATDVFNFSPQFGVGVHIFTSKRGSVDFAANAVHISNASMGDHNMGVNAAVMLSAGYTWWK
jgi:lipid A 3-O-deacylase